MMEAELLVALRNDELHVEYNGVDWVQGIEVAVPIAGRWLRSADGTLIRDEPELVEGTDRLGSYTGWRVTYWDEERALISLTIRAYRLLRSVVFEAEALTDLEHTFADDSFVHTTFQAPIMRVMDAEFLLYTWGLTDQGRKGGWPHAIYGRSQRQIPRDKAFAPLVLSAQGSAMVIAPLDHYPLSPLGIVDMPDGVAISRGIHGAVDRIPCGTVISTIVTFGAKPFSTMRSWGDILLSISGKERPGPLSLSMLSRLGYWNNYGAYYSELLHPIDEDILLALGEYFRKDGIPIGYFGLDLWYPHARVGFAKAYRTDRKRFPSGLDRIKTRTGIPFFLHLSGFDSENEYRDDYAFQQGGGAACPQERRFYTDLGRRLNAEEGAIGVWHDHIRVYQERISQLRNSFNVAEEWFFSMADELGANDLPLMLSDPTIGFLLASSRATNIVSSRSGDDYLVKQEGQLAQLDPIAAVRYKHVPTQRLITDRFLVGWLHYSLGLLPFHDVFITNRTHPDGFAESDADSEALMRALSAGPVGVGDKIGEIDQEIVNRLVFPDGVLAKPDRPLRPMWGSLSHDLIVGETESVGGAWRYIAVFNIGTGGQDYDLQDVGLLTEEQMIYSPSLRMIVPKMKGSLPPAGGDYYVLAPLLSGIALIGFLDKYITAPSDRILWIEATDAGFDVRMRVPPGRSYPVGAFLDGELTVEADGAKVAIGAVEDGLHVFAITPMGEECTLRVRKGEGR